jgi:hypothetical protein
VTWGSTRAPAPAVDSAAGHCGASLQIDGSSARSGQDIVTIPHLRWSINFTQPTEDPSTEGFTVEVDDVSIGNGLLLNGKPPAQPSQYQDVAAPEDDTASAPRPAPIYRRKSRPMQLQPQPTRESPRPRQKRMPGGGLALRGAQPLPLNYLEA